VPTSLSQQETLTYARKKPLTEYRKIVVTLQVALDIMTGIRKIRENIPAKEAITSVIDERRDFVRYLFCFYMRLSDRQDISRSRLSASVFMPASTLSVLASRFHSSFPRAAQLLPSSYTLSRPRWMHTADQGEHLVCPLCTHLRRAR
jgi:hypothetical protein